MTSAISSWCPLLANSGALTQNKQLGALVFGLNASVSDAQISGKARSGANAPCEEAPCPTNVDWFATVNAKLGYVFDDLIEPYVAVGLTTGHVLGAADPGACGGTSGSCTYDQQGTGMDFGAGVAFAVSKMVTLKAEVDHVDLGPPTFGPVSSGFGVSGLDITFNAVKLTADLHF